MVRPAGFEPASEAWKASILTRLDYGRRRRESIVSGCDLRVLIKWTKLGGSVEGFDPETEQANHREATHSRRNMVQFYQFHQ